MSRLSALSWFSPQLPRWPKAQQPKGSSPKQLRDTSRGSNGQDRSKERQSDGVKPLGKMLIDDQSQANKKAIDAAKSMNVTAPNGPNAKTEVRLGQDGRDDRTRFDKSFAQHMVKDHKKDIAAYEKKSKSKDASGEYAPNPCQHYRCTWTSAEASAPSRNASARFHHR